MKREVPSGETNRFHLIPSNVQNWIREAIGRDGKRVVFALAHFLIRECFRRGIRDIKLEALCRIQRAVQDEQRLRDGASDGVPRQDKAADVRPLTSGLAGTQPANQEAVS